MQYAVTLQMVNTVDDKKGQNNSAKIYFQAASRIKWSKRFVSPCKIV